MITSGLMSSATDDWATPQALFDSLDKEFGFTLDACASHTNFKVDNYFTQDDDGLSKTWSGVVWMNQPYGREIAKWMNKALLSAREGATVVCLVPARTDTAWWWDYAMKGEIRFIRGRLKFNDGKNAAPFPSALVIFGGS